MPAGEDLGALAEHRTTLVIHLGAQAIEEIVATLSEHYGEDCPAAVVARASWPDEVVLTGTLQTIAGQAAAANITRTATIIVGPALAPQRLPREPPLLRASASAKALPVLEVAALVVLGLAPATALLPA